MEMSLGESQGVKLYSIFSTFPGRSILVERGTHLGGWLLVPFVDVIDQIAWKKVPGFLAVQASGLRFFSEVGCAVIVRASAFTHCIYPTKRKKLKPFF